MSRMEKLEATLSQPEGGSQRHSLTGSETNIMQYGLNVLLSFSEMRKERNTRI